MPPVYALNLFDLADNDDYLAYQRASNTVLSDYDASIVALGQRSAGGELEGDDPTRQVLLVLKWPSREVFEQFLADDAGPERHALRHSGTERYVWQLFDETDFRALFAAHAAR